MDDFKKQLDEDFAQLLLETINQNNIEQFRMEFLQVHPYDRAKFFIKQPKDIRLQIYEYLSAPEMAEIFENIELEEQEAILSEMVPSYAAEMLGQMYADDAVDVLNELDKDQVVSYLTIMDVQAAKEIKELLHYEEKTAGSIMTTEFVAIPANQTIQAAMKILKQKAPNAETIYYIYVVDKDKRLVGVISLRDLIISEDDQLISDVMSDRIVSVSVGDDQEEVARMIKDYDFLALPVVDFKGHLLGIITVDDVIDVIDEEASEDYSKLAAVSDMDKSDKSSFGAAKKRLPWLIILMFLGMLTASLIGQFETTIQQVSILAVFMPLIAGMAGNTGTQSLAVVVRGIATGEIDEKGMYKLVLKEAGTGIIIGITCGVLIMVLISIWQQKIFLGILVGVAILVTLTVATIAGALVPMIAHRFNIDPAVASGPFIQTVNDMISILIYFGLATVFMSYLIK